MTTSLTPPPGAVALANDWLANDPAQALANFTWVNNVTLAAAHCHFAYASTTNDGAHCLARHLALPFTAISVEGREPAIVRQLAAELLAPDEAAYTLAPTRIAALLGQAVRVLTTQPEWQMLYQGIPAHLDPGPARRLEAADLPAMIGLAAAGEAMVFSPDSLARGAFFGVFAGDELVAMGGVQTELPGLAEIGSIVTHPAHRRRGYASQIVAALIHHLRSKEQQVFLCLFQTNTTARMLYEKLGFVIIDELHLLRWQREK